MTQVLEVTPDERPVLSYMIARSLPTWRSGSSEQQEVAGRLSYVLANMDEAPPGTGEVELFTQDLYELGIHLFASAVDLEEYWLDRRELGQGREPAEPEDPEVAAAVGRYFPEIDRDPASWDYRRVEAAVINLGFKIDRLLTAESPRVRGIYNKERTVLSNTAAARRRQNAAFREQRQGATIEPRRALPAALAVPAGAHDEDEAPAPRPRPAGTAEAPVRSAASGLKTISRATFPPQYLWGVETGTGVNADDLEPGRARRVNVGGEQLMLGEVEGKVCAASRVCPHRGWDLSKSPIAADGTITCSLHGAVYDFCSGAVLRQPYDPEFNRTHPLMGGLMSGLDPKKESDPLPTYPTSVADDGEVRVHI